MDNQQKEETSTQQTNTSRQVWLSWVVTGVLVAVLVSILYWQPILANQLAERNGSEIPILVEPAVHVTDSDLASMPYFEMEESELSLVRVPETQTIALRFRSEPVDYTVATGDAVSALQRNNISPETLLWSNYDVLKDDPHNRQTGIDHTSDQWHPL